ncbi:3-ketoacyl-ACP reductase [miscellaneous Crenarchaeota group-15 archaeon DG-45]|uniref:3-ketoacyl-ACP reductase n=1 Tax=miscellaneous Crenarchaeota group-15 archaeon DG-45 TaxID=1685127 RepID=A0A0M0BTI9_9ARCH|nr:MAG: 3-ketoacyl-ACP reductase [miscellaneous Crenarchaeota group-15 archaeon DG-45]
MRLAGKVALVTGAGAGIGRAIALALVREGASVVACDVDEETARGTSRIIEGEGGSSLPVRMDVRSDAEIDGAVLAALERFGGIDILVNNAGVSTMSRVVDMTEEEWDHNMDVNAKGVFLCSRAVAREMIGRGGGGKIVNVASMAGKRGAPLLAHYCASKFAVVGFTQSLALELAPHRINVNAVCPGYVETSMQRRELLWQAELEGRTPEQVRAEYIASTPLGRLEQPEDVARVVVFLCTGDADFMTGQAINVTGGVEMR